MGSRIGLIFKAKGMPSAAKQLRVLLDSGVQEGDIWEDTAKRSTLDNWLLSGRVLSEGDTLVVVTLNALGDTGRKQHAVERKLEKMDISVEVAESDEPPSRPRGRPPVHAFSPEQEDLLRGLWKDQNVPRPTVLAQAERVMGKPVSVATMKRKFGPRGSK